MDKKYIQLPRFQTHRTKSDAISLVERHINVNIAEFFDGEEIVIEYISPEGNQMYSTAVIKINDGIAKLFVSIEESETLKIVETEEEPQDKDVIWLTDKLDDDEEDVETMNLRAEVSLLKSELQKIKNLVNRHDYALSSTIAGGDIVTNSEKYDLENMTDPEQPSDAVSYEEYATDDLVVTSFDLFIGNSTLGVYNKLYKGQKYFLKLRMFNAGKEQVKWTTETLTIECTPSEIATVSDANVLLATKAGNIQVVATLTTTDGKRIRNIYPAEVFYNEEPDYETYSEPNVRHVILKTAENPTILAQNSDYLCINEPIWCISECALYVKAKAPNGQIKLYKISGDGGTIDPDTGTTGDTTSVTIETKFTVEEDGTLSVTSNDESAIYVDENGILVINVGGVVDDILTLNDNESGGGGGGGGDIEPPSDQSSGSVDGEGGLIIDGNTRVENGILLLSANVTPEGILEITG